MSEQTWMIWMFVAGVVGALAGMFWPLLVATWKEGPRDYIGGLNSWISFLGVSLIIAIVVTALGFFAFLQGDDTRKMLMDLGFLAYFSAFTYGFGSGSAIEEPLKA